MAAGTMGAWDLNLRTGETTWDAKQYELFGRPFDRPLNHEEEFYAAIHPDDVTRVREAARQAEESGTFAAEFRIISSDGTIRWLSGHGATVTDGNAIQAGLDRDGVDGVDVNSEAGSATRNFSFVYNPLNPNNNSGEAPVAVPQTYPGSAFQQGSVTQLFYISNWYHDEIYRLGFTEQARNFQNSNFGRGGVDLTQPASSGPSRNCSIAAIRQNRIAIGIPTFRRSVL